MALAPSSNFGPLAGKLWIGNFGDGHINAFDPDSGAFIDQVRDPAEPTIPRHSHGNRRCCPRASHGEGFSA
jgi:hypothetical protein